MPLSDELRRPLPPFRPVLPTKPEIGKVVERMRALWGEPGLGGGREETEHTVEAAARLLTRANGDLRGLTYRQIKAVAQLLWQPRPEWGGHGQFVQRWLDWADAEWRPATAAKRVWRQHLLRFDPESAATQEVAAWLRGKAALLPEAYREFSEDWQMFKVGEAPRTIASSVMSGDDFAEQVERLGIARGTVYSSSLMASILEAVGNNLLSGHIMEEPAQRLAALLGNPSGALRRIDASPILLRRARSRLADGLVYWAVRRGDEQAERQILDLLLSVLDDPRISPAAWDGVSRETILQVEAWLSRKTLEVFFRIIDHLNTDTPHQWPYRKRFWESFLPRISRAWLLCGKNARSIAELAGVRSGTIGGIGVLSDHCALMIQIGGVTVIEMNKNASALFYETGNPKTPRFYETDRPYDRSAMIHGSDTRLRHDGSETGRWQENFAQFIADRTGIRVGR